MSIIHNALKKTQEKINSSDTEAPKKPLFNPQGASGQTPPPTPPPTANANNDSTPNKKVTLISIIALVLLLGGIISFFLLGDKNTSNKTQIPIQNTSTPKAKTVVISDDAEIENIASRLSFQGTASNGNSFAALIDNDIYEEGQTINGMTIKLIKKNEIVLELNGKIVTLTSK